MVNTELKVRRAVVVLLYLAFGAGLGATAASWYLTGLLMETIELAPHFAVLSRFESAARETFYRLAAFGLLFAVIHEFILHKFYVRAMVQR